MPINLLTPKLLFDKKRLQEIYNLRVEAYQDSSFSDFVNLQLYPSGWFDFLDPESFHYVVELNNRIVASARLSIVNDFDKIIKLGNQIDENLVPLHRPFAFFSRLVVAKEFRGRGLSAKFDEIRSSKFIELNLPFVIAVAREHRCIALKKLGFNSLGLFNNTENPKSEMLNCLLINRTD